MRRSHSIRRTTVGQTREDVLAFTAGGDLALDRVLVEPDCLGTAAHVTMLSRIAVRPRLLTAQERRRVIAELVAIMRRARRGAFRITLRDQDVHLAVERSLTRALGALGRKVHTARSRNDQVAVDLRLHAKRRMLDILESALQVAGVLAGLARRHADSPMVGRTHLQPAMPSSVGLWAAAHAESLLDDGHLLRAAYRLNDRCPLGSAAGYGVPLPIDRALTARLLGFAAPIGNVLYAGNARGKCEAAVLAAADQVMLTLSRLATDLILFLMPEFDYVRLPAGYGTGSSIMPQKNNPDVLELIRARAVRVAGCAAGAAQVVRGLPSGYHRDLQETKGPLIEGLETTLACLAVLAPLLGALEVNQDALRAGFRPAVFAADKALELVGRGMPFRDAYAAVKGHLEQLRAADPVQALRARAHLGAPGALGLDAVEAHIGEGRRFVGAERRAWHAALGRLLGVDYPALVKGGT